jgi:heptosyltransferase-1
MPIPGRNFRRILIVRLGAMGDVIHGMPAVAALRAAFPEAQFGWVIEERWSDLLHVRGTERVGVRTAKRPLVEAVHFANTHLWRKAPFSDETWREMLALRRELRSTQYGAVVDLQGSLKSGLVANVSGAPTRFGFANPRERLATMFYTEVVSTTAAHVVEQNMELAAALMHQPTSANTAQVGGTDIFPQDDAAEEWCTRVLAQHGVSEFVIINPGAGWGAKCWPAERYAEVAMALGEMNLATIVNFGPAEEELAQSVVQNSTGVAFALKMALPELIAITRRARLFVGGDTGPLHLAAALRVPVVALFGPTDPQRNGPYGTQAVVLRSQKSRTSHHRTADPDAGLMTITSEEVITAARKLLEQPNE